MASPIGFTLRIASLALVCACMGGCPDEGAGEGGGSSASAGMGGSDPATDAGTVTTAGNAGSSGGAGSDSTDEPSFSEQHAAEIQKDCSESVNCLLQRDEQLEQNPFEECIADSSDALDGDERRQAAFLTNYERCKAYVVCDYYDCALSGVSGYGASQAPAVRMKCDADSACRAESGTPDPDPVYAVDACVAIVTGELDAYTESERTRWETALVTCSTLTSCDYVSCFQMR